MWDDVRYEWSMINILLICTVIGVFYTLDNWKLLLSIAVITQHACLLIIKICVFVTSSIKQWRYDPGTMVGWWLWGVILPCFFSIPIARHGKILQQKVMFEGFENRPEVQLMEDEAWLRGIERGVNHGEPAFDPGIFNRCPKRSSGPWLYRRCFWLYFGYSLHQ